MSIITQKTTIPLSMFPSRSSAPFANVRRTNPAKKALQKLKTVVNERLLYLAASSRVCSLMKLVQQNVQQLPSEAKAEQQPSEVSKSRVRNGRDAPC